MIDNREQMSDGHRVTDLEQLHQMLDRGTDILVDSEGKLIFSNEQEKGIAEAQAKFPKTTLKHQEWHADLPPWVEVCNQIEIPDIIFQAMERYGERNPLTGERVKATDSRVMIVYSQNVWEQIEKIAVESGRREREALILVWGMVVVGDGNKTIYSPEKIEPRYSESRTSSGTEETTVTGPSGLILIGLPHTHLPSFSEEIWGAFSGTLDYSQAMESAFTGEVGNSDTTDRYFGVITDDRQGGIHLGHYLYDRSKGETFYKGKRIPGGICKSPGVFVENDDQMLFVQSPLFYGRNQIIEDTYLVAKKGGDGKYVVEPDWRKPKDDRQKPESTKQQRWH